MRKAQKAYLKNPDMQTLLLAKAAERQVDKALKHLDSSYT
jgi:hypothetical protein